MKNYKKLLCISLTAASLLIGNSGFAAQQTAVERAAFMPPAEKIIVDDNLEGESLYPIATALNSANSVTEDDGNTAVKLKGFDKGLHLIAKDNLTDSDRLVISFDIKATGTSLEEAITADKKLNATKRSPLNFGVMVGATGPSGNAENGMVFSTSVKSSPEPDLENKTLVDWAIVGKDKKDDAGNTIKNSVGKNVVFVQDNEERNGYVNVTMMLERQKNGVYVKMLYVDGKSVLTDDMKKGFSADADWWSYDGGPKLIVQSRMSSSIDLYNYFDNFLVYTPEPFRAESVVADSDNSGASVFFNYAVDKTELPEFTLTDGENTYKCTSSKGESDNEIYVSFPSGLNLLENSYYLETDFATSVLGDNIQNARLLLGKKYADSFSASAVKNENEIFVNTEVSPKFDGDVYAAAAAFKGNNIVDFKVQKITLDEGYDSQNFEISLDGADALSADRVQVFLIDSTQNMNIISDVETIEF